ncbi:MAG: acyl transferase [Bacteroidetes bacterium]|nr:MAG: acyl transferase [Bacteroidota bacterium]
MSVPQKNSNKPFETKFKSEHSLLVDSVRSLLNYELSVSFKDVALKVFAFQVANNEVYREFVSLMGIDWMKVNNYRDIPFMPVEFFRSHKVISGEFEPEVIYRSSGTSNSGARSEHRIRSVAWYNEVSNKIYSRLVRPVKECIWFALLPGYIDRGDASLVAMAKSFMDISEQSDRFYLDNYMALQDDLMSTLSNDRPVVVIGVTHALLSWLEVAGISDSLSEKLAKSSLTIIETGGMKGHGREPIREEVHSRIKRVIPNATIISEYGMTELLSQAYCTDGRYFTPPATMEIIVRDVSDPGTEVKRGRTGRLQIIDLANIDSCSFLSTSDLGSLRNEIGSSDFEVLGRFDHAEVRGCNLLTV